MIFGMSFGTRISALSSVLQGLIDNLRLRTQFTSREAALLGAILEVTALRMVAGLRPVSYRILT